MYAAHIRRIAYQVGQLVAKSPDREVAECGQTVRDLDMNEPDTLDVPHDNAGQKNAQHGPEGDKRHDRPRAQHDNKIDPLEHIAFECSGEQAAQRGTSNEGTSRPRWHSSTWECCADSVRYFVASGCTPDG